MAPQTRVMRGQAGSWVLFVRKECVRRPAAPAPLPVGLAGDSSVASQLPDTRGAS